MSELSRMIYAYLKDLAAMHPDIPGLHNETFAAALNDLEVHTRPSNARTHHIRRVNRHQDTLLPRLVEVFHLEDIFSESEAMERLHATTRIRHLLNKLVRDGTLKRGSKADFPNFDEQRQGLEPTRDRVFYQRCDLHVVGGTARNAISR